MTVKTWRVKE